MFAVRPCPLPDDALLASYRENGAYADCFSTDIAGPVSHEQFVVAFYTSFVFKLERSILKWAVSKPSTDAQAKLLASGSIDEFAAWRVEKRSPNQLLLTDYRGSTRSWLMVVPITTESGPGTRLYFGSAVVPVKNRRTGQSEMGLVFRVLLGFHKLYSRALLHAARSRLSRDSA